MENYDFGGWCTKSNIKCTDGLTILPDAFAHCDGEKVPLVWMHNHNSVDNVLGHAILHSVNGDMYSYCSFNDTEQGQYAKAIVKHGDVDSLSIYANKLVKEGNCVKHGTIREVSLVLAGANPGAHIDFVLAQADNSEGECAIMQFDECLDLELEHSDNNKDNKEDVKMAENKTETPAEEGSEKTIKEIFDAMTEEQKNVVYAMVGAAIEDERSKNEGEGEEMTHNVFENDEVREGSALSHAEMTTIITDAKRYGSMKDSFLAHAQEYGIENIEYLFPEAKNVTTTPEFIRNNPTDWVKVVMNGVKHNPFSRIKSVFADITEDEARAKGYIKGKKKKDEVFTLLKRTTTPTTIYKKQKLDRDDVIDITDMDVVAFIKSEMREKLDEEIARAVLFSDNRLSSSDDKINETNVRPVISDDELYTIKKAVTVGADETEPKAVIRSTIEALDEYQGSGNLTMFMATSYITKMLLLEDKMGRRLYNTMADLEAALNVDRIVKVPSNIVPAGVIGVALDLRDYYVGADRGGAVNMFDDFDIDYNQQKYLIETRISGALVKPYSAVVLKTAGAE